MPSIPQPALSPGGPLISSEIVTSPRVSVLMAVRDGAPWVKDAVASVLTQTLTDLELIVVDDGSTDATPHILAGVSDPRVRVARRPREGLTPALNHGLGLARAPIVARLDADDVALPERLARQVAFLDTNPEVGVLGSAAREVNGDGREVRVVRPPEDDAALRHALIRRNPMVHSTVTMRRAAIERVGGYDPLFAVAQDYDLWMRLAGVTRLANLREPLVVRRLLPRRVSVARDADRLRAEARARWRAVRTGAYPAWCLAFAVRPLLALALPAPLRRALRRARA
jgi:glycosyltransferase involved in cell wall biosynthesis